MRNLPALAAVLLAMTVAAPLDVAAQQPAPPSTPMPSAGPTTPSVTKAKRKHRTARARHHRVRYAAVRRLDSPCAIIDGWRAFPTHDRYGFFDTRPVCRRY